MTTLKDLDAYRKNSGFVNENINDLIEKEIHIVDQYEDEREKSPRLRQVFGFCN